jgi:hypothetical protein
MNIQGTLRKALHEAKDRASDFTDRHSEAIGSALDKAGVKVDKLTKFRYSDRITTGREKAKSAVGGFARHHRHDAM